MPFPILLEIKKQLKEKRKKYFSLSVKTFNATGTSIKKKNPLYAQKYLCHFENGKVIVDALDRQ